MMKLQALLFVSLGVISMALSGCGFHSESQAASQDAVHGETHEGSEQHGHKIIVTCPVRKDVVSTQPYVCQIHSCKHIEVRALKRGYIQEIRVNEGQAVKKGDLLFQILPTLYQAKLDSEIAEAQRIQIELNNAESLNKKGIVAEQEIAIRKAELAKAQANVMLARAELNFASITAPFDGIVDRQHNQLGSLVEEGDVLTTLSDNRLMWVYFNVPEARYLEYKAELDKSKPSLDDDKASDGTAPTHSVSLIEGNKAAPDRTQPDNLRIELRLANGEIFQQAGTIGAIEADFNNTTGNIPFRADFPNPDGLLRNGQTGTILIHRILDSSLVIPQRATFPILDKLYVFVVGSDGVVHQRYITTKSEQDDIFVIDQGLKEGDKIILEGIRQVRDGDKIQYDFKAPAEVLSHLKYHAE